RCHEFALAVRDGNHHRHLKDVDVDLTTTLLSRTCGRSLRVDNSPNCQSEEEGRDGLDSHGRDYSIPRRVCSSMIDTPLSRALSSFEPGSLPATRKLVFLLTDEVTRPPCPS